MEFVIWNFILILISLSRSTIIATRKSFMFLTIVTVIVIILIIAIALVMHYMGHILGEFHDHFLSMSALMLLFLIGAGIFLSYAVPSMASPNPYEKQSGDIKVYRDTPRKDLTEIISEKTGWNIRR